MREGTKLAVLVTMAWSMLAGAFTVPRRLMYGEPVPDGSRTEVTWVVSGSSVCSSVFVGPRVVLTVAHCVEDGGTTIALDRGKRLYGVGRRMPKDMSDIDLAIVLLNDERTNGPFGSVSSRIAPGVRVDMFGQGCTEDGKPSDGKFRRGVSEVARFDDDEVELEMDDGAVACFGDSGGPIFRRIEGFDSLELVGLISKGNISDTTYGVRLGDERVVRFLKRYANDEYAICGVNRECPLPFFEFPHWEIPKFFP